MPQHGPLPRAGRVQGPGPDGGGVRQGRSGESPLFTPVSQFLRRNDEDRVQFVVDACRPSLRRGA